MNIGDGAHVTGPFDKPVASIRSGHQVNYRSFIVGKHSLTGLGYRAPFRAEDGDGEVIQRHKVGRDGTVAVHGDGGLSAIDIFDGAHIASPVDKSAASIWSRHEVNYRSSVIGKHSLTGCGYGAPCRARE